MKRLLLLLSTIIFLSAEAQIVDTVTNQPPMPNNASGHDNFTTEVYSTAPLTIKTIGLRQGSGNSIDVWYRPGGVRHTPGSPPNVTTANGWILAESAISFSNPPGSTGLVPVPHVFDIPVNPGTPVGICIAGRINYTASSVINNFPHTFSDDNNYLTIDMGPGKGHSAFQSQWPNVNSAAKFPVYFGFEITDPCPTPPVAGVTVSADSVVCLNSTTRLSMPNVQIGVGQTYQWQTSPDNNTWTDLAGYESPVANNVVITGDAYFRCQVTCGGTTVSSTPVFVESQGASLSGTYSINENAPTGGTNFESFGDLIDAWECGGISGPVVVNVLGGPYDERVVIKQVGGTSSTNTITINGNASVLEYTGNTVDDRSTLLLDGADWVHVDNLTIKANGSAQGWAVHLINGADHNTFTNCSFEVSDNIVTQNVMPFVISAAFNSPIGSGDGASGSYNRIEDCVMKGGGYGVSISAPPTHIGVSNVFKNNTIQDFFTYGLYVSSQDSVLIEGNDISRPNRQPSTSIANPYGMYIVGDWNAPLFTNGRVIGNRIHDLFTSDPLSTGAAYGVSFASAGSPDSANGNLFANNVIYNINHEGPLYGMVFPDGSPSDYWKIYHNTIVFDDPQSVSSSQTVLFSCPAARGAGQGNLYVKNNLFYLNRGPISPSYFYLIDDVNATLTINNNAYFSPGMSNSNVNFASRSGDIATFAAWQGVNSNAYDQDGKFAHIGFVNPASGNFQPTIPTIDNIGADLTAEVSVDFDSVVRAAAPDPGAWEFDPVPGTDIAVLSFTSPSGASCIGSQDVEVEVASLGTDLVETLYFSWTLDGVDQGPVAPISVNLNSGDVTTASIGSFTLAGNTSYDIAVTLDSTGPGTDVDASNNVLVLQDVRAGISGQYTINQALASSATNFSSFNDFAAAVNAYGICGPVEVDVVEASGPYVEQVRFLNVANTSSTNTITINGNGNELTYRSQNNSARYTLAMQGTSHVTIDSLIMTAEGTGNNEYGWPVWMSAGASFNTIKNSQIFCDSSTNSANFAGIVVNGSPTTPTTQGNTGESNVFENNNIVGGYYGIVIMSVTQAAPPGGGGGGPIRRKDDGSGGAPSVDRYGLNHKIHNNTISEFGLSGIYVGNHNRMEIIGNEIHRENRVTQTSMSAILVQNAANHFHNGKIVANIIRNSCTGNPTQNIIQRGIVVNGGGADTSQNLMANNLIYNFDGVGSIAGIDLGAAATTHWDVYHNTIVMESDRAPANANTYTRGIYLNNVGEKINIRNNLITLDRSMGPHHCLYYQAANFGGVSDYNGMYVPSGSVNYVGRIGNSDVVSLNAWRAAGFDTNSVFARPFYYDPGAGDYRPGTVAFDGAGTDLLALVPEDIGGQPRTATPDMGAWEYDPIPCLGPINERIDSITATSVFLSWESEESEWEIEWGFPSFEVGTGIGTVVGSITNNQGYELTGLSPDTCVDVYIREICGSDTSQWSLKMEVCTPFENDVLPIGLASPNDFACGDSLTEVKVIFRNEGFLPATGFDVGVVVNSPTPQVASTTYTGTLNQGEEDTASVTIIAAVGGNYSFSVFTNYTSDDNIDNDTLMRTVYMNDGGPVDIIASQDTICGLSNVQLWINPDILGEFIWMDPATMDTLSTDDTLHLNDIDQNTTVMVRTVPGIPEQSVGPRDTTIGNAVNTTVANGQLAAHFLEFETFESIVLRRVKVYPQSAGSLDLILRDSSNTIVWAEIVNVPTGGGLPVILNLDIPIDNPGRYSMGARSQGSNIGGLLRNSEGANFPYTIPGLVSITGSTTNQAGDYRYFYDMVFGSGSCPRPDTEFTIHRAEPPVASFADNHTTVNADSTGFSVTFDASGSSDASGFEWDFGDNVGTASGDSVSYTFTQNGTYTVTLIASNTCGSDTITEEVVVTGISVENFSVAQNLNVYPNPGNGRFTLTFNQANSSDLLIEFVDIAGQTIWNETRKSFSGEYLKEYDMQALAAGVYMLRISNGEGRTTRRVIIQ